MIDITKNRNFKNYRVLIAHPAKQHSLNTAKSFKDLGFNITYATTVYMKTRSLTFFLSKFLRGNNLKRARTRNNSSISENEILLFCEFLGLLLLLIRRIDRKKIVYNKLDSYINDRFNKKVAKYAIKEKFDFLVAYDTHAYTLFKYLEAKSSNIVKILDMSAPVIDYMELQFKNDASNSLYTNQKYKKYIKSSTYKRKKKNALEEILLTDYFFSASSFTTRSLEYVEVNPTRIFLLQYGLNIKEKLKCKEESLDKINIIFVGAASFKKGIHYFLELIDRMGTIKFNYFVFGDTADLDKKILKKYNQKCLFTGHITKDEINYFYENSDILFFPSLADGFGLSLVEALSNGVIVLTTKSTGASDLVVNDYNGYVFNDFDMIKICEYINNLVDNRIRFTNMKKNALLSSRQLTWENYRIQLEKAMNNIINN